MDEGGDTMMNGNLNPKPREGVELWRGEDGQLWAQTYGDGGTLRTPVRVVRCFPWSAPSRFLSLRNGDDEEVALVRDLAELGPIARRALSMSLLEAGFVLEIDAVESVDEEIEIRTFVVRTKQGRRTFQTLRDEWPRELPGGALLIRDVVGDLYLLREPDGLDEQSQRLLWAYVDLRPARW